jgi:hypothetical protein
MKAEKLLNLEGESPEFLEEEEAAKDWDRRVVSVLVNFEFSSIFEDLGECLINNSVELARPCLVAATWPTHMLKVLPDTGVWDVSRHACWNHLLWSCNHPGIWKKESLQHLL